MGKRVWPSRADLKPADPNSLHESLIEIKSTKYISTFGLYTGSHEVIR